MRKSTENPRSLVSEDDFAGLMRGVAEGSEEAAWRVVEAYGPHVLRAVRRTLHEKVRRQFDSQDFVQAVWASLFAGRARFCRVESPQQLIALLTTIARNKVIDVVRQRTTTQKYDVDREVSSSHEQLASHLACDPSPSQVAMARERWEQMLRDKPDHYRKIIQFRLRGDSYHEIADKLQLSDKTVQRVLGRLLREQVA